MIFLSAQPDTEYFIWQLNVQLNNFKQFGICKKDIHVLISYDKKKGVNKTFLRFSNENCNLANFFFYPDIRTSKAYISSIRPHIIAQHYNNFPHLTLTPVFYHDSDIVFTESLPDFERLCKDNIWYFSDARSYLDVSYINEKGPSVLQDMCDVLKIKKSLIQENDEHAGGAQYILKNIDSKFWKKIENDSTKLYKYLIKNQSRYEREYFAFGTREHDAKYIPISSWCADMWAILWNAFKIARVRIDKDLDFCWPMDNKHLWTKRKIYHDAGIDISSKNRYFYKGLYNKWAPYDDYLDFVSKEDCSYLYVKKIQDIAKEKRYDLSDVTFILLASSVEDSLIKISLALRFLKKFFTSNFLIVELMDSIDMNENTHMSFTDCDYIKTNGPLFTLTISEILEKTKTDLLCFYDTDYISSPVHIDSNVQLVKNLNTTLALANGYFRKGLAKCLLDRFDIELDISMLHKYRSPKSLQLKAWPAHVVVKKNSIINCCSKMRTYKFFFIELAEKLRCSGHSINYYQIKSDSTELSRNKFFDNRSPQQVEDFIRYLNI